MKTYRIDGFDFTNHERLQDLYIEAESFDEALAQARKVNKNYFGGQVVDRRPEVEE